MQRLLPLLIIQAMSGVSYLGYYVLFEAAARGLCKLAQGKVRAGAPSLVAFAVSVPLHHVLMRLAARGNMDLTDGVFKGLPKTAALALVGLLSAPLFTNLWLALIETPKHKVWAPWLGAATWAVYHGYAIKHIFA